MTKRIMALTSIVLSLMFVTLFVSCNNDDDNSNGGSNAENTIAGKWVISDSSSPYASFEFTEDGHYIVEGKTTLQSTGTVSKPVKSLSTKRSIKTAGGFSLSVKDDDEGSDQSPTVNYGEYTREGEIIHLLDYGTIEITNITDKEIRFTFTLEATGEIYNFVAEKAAPVSTSSKMDLLCDKLWVFQRLEWSNIEVTDPTNPDLIYYQQYYGDNWEAQMLESINNDNNWIVANTFDRLISKAGTYLMIVEGGGVYLSQWKWTDEGETAMDVSGNNWATSTTLTIVELTSNTLVVQKKQPISWDSGAAATVTLTQYYTYTPSAN